jgi:amino acid transporter
MDVDRLNTGEKIAGGSAVLLFIFMFFDWFKVEVSGGDGLFSVSEGGNAWDVFSTIDIILMIVVLVAVGVAVIRLRDAAFEPPFSLNTAVAVLGGIAVLLILYRIIDPPLDSDITGVDISRSIGIYLGLIAAAGITYGGYRAMQEEGTSFGDVGDQLSNRGGSGTGTPPQQPPAATPPPPPPPSSGQGGPPQQ